MICPECGASIESEQRDSYIAHTPRDDDPNAAREYWHVVATCINGHDFLTGERGINTASLPA